LFTDTTLSDKLDYSLLKIQQASEQTSDIVKNLDSVISRFKEGEGTAALFFADTALRNNLIRSGLSIEQGTSRFNENMEALQSNFLFRPYFKKQEKIKKKNSSQKN
jgi:phospholipid/cholesterol/gamma-HCH transport system substrate-binding protein